MVESPTTKEPSDVIIPDWIPFGENGIVTHYMIRANVVSSERICWMPGSIGPRDPQDHFLNYMPVCRFVPTGINLNGLADVTVLIESSNPFYGVAISSMSFDDAYTALHTGVEQRSLGFLRYDVH